MSSTQVNALPTTPASNLLKAGVKEVQYRIQGLIPSKGICLITGAPGCFKSWTALHISLCCIFGAPFLGQFPVIAGKVLFIDSENPETTIASRLSKLCSGLSIDISDPRLNNLIFSVFPDLKMDDSRSIAALLAVVDSFQPDIIIFDSLVRLMIGSEDKSSDVRRLFDNIKPIFANNPRLIIILHHSVKSPRITGMQSVRGSGDLSAFTDVLLTFKPSARQPRVFVEISKHRHLPLDSSNKNFAFDIISEGTSLKLKFLDSQIQTSILDDCKNQILDWVEAENIAQFQTRHCLSFLESNGYKRSIGYDALAELVSAGDLCKLRRGLYGVKAGGLTTGI